jgi:hypothetical protein
MKKIIKITKNNSDVFIRDNSNHDICIDGGYDMQKYEKENNVKMEDMLIDFLSEKDENYSKKGFNKIIKDVKEMVDANNIDYFAIGDVSGEPENTICIMFNLNNRLSTIDCELRVFNSSYRDKDEVEIQISFSQGAGSQYGYNFFKYFNYQSYMTYIKPILKKYFESREDEKVEKELIQYFATDIIKNIEYYYE